MEINKVSIALYLHEHPILAEPNKTRRKKYMNFLAYYTNTGESRYSDSLLALYKKIIVADETYEPVPTPVISGLFKYRHALYMDVWFINAFLNKEKASTLLTKLQEKSKLAWIYKKKMQLLYERLYLQDNGVKFPKIELLIDMWRANEQFFQQPIQKIAFTANMSAGKSTLINALIGKKVNMSQSMACTAKLHYIYNKPFEDGFSAEDDNILNLDADYDTLMTDDEQNTTTKITVSSYFRLMSGISTPLCLIDTPGVNSALDPTHKHITDMEIVEGNYDKLVYVINADGNIASDDEHVYMAQLAETIKASPIIFVVNKLDTFRVKEDNIAESLRKIKEDIERLGFKNSMVCPVSAYTGYLAKIVAFDNNLDEDEKDEFDTKRRLFKREVYNLSKYYPTEVVEQCKMLISSETSQKRQQYLQLLCDCGILPLEYMLINRNEG